MSILASRKALGSSVPEAPALARASMSAHLLRLVRPGAASHFLRRASFRALFGRRFRSSLALSSDCQGSWLTKTSVWKWSLRVRRLRLIDLLVRHGTVNGFRKAYSTCGCNGLFRLTLFPLLSPPFSTSMYVAIALLFESSRSLARRSQTHACAPRRPEYTQRTCLKPKSSLSATSTTLIAIVI